MSQLARCSFYVRELVTVEPTTYHYRQIGSRGPSGGLELPTPFPPAIGDLMTLADEERGVGTFRVVDRSWLHSSYGSFDWPYPEPVPSVGPLVDVVVEPAEGVFANEAELGDEA